MIGQSTGYYIEIRPFTEDENDRGFRRMWTSGRHNAERVECGANINLNHAKYYTRIVDVAATIHACTAPSGETTEAPQ